MKSQFMRRERQLALSELRVVKRSKSQSVVLSDARMDALKNLPLSCQKAEPRSLKVESASMPLICLQMVRVNVRTMTFHAL